MKLLNLLYATFIWSFAYCHYIQRESTPEVVSGITTVTTGLGLSTTLTSECAFATHSGSINGKRFKAAYEISGETTTSVVAAIPFRNRELTVTWLFTFDEPLDANDFKVRQLGVDISSIDGYVNLEEGSFLVTYQVTLPFITYLTSAIDYCLFEYVAFDFHKVDSAGNDFFYLLYTDNLGSALVDGLRGAVCDIFTATNCPIYQAQLPFDCEAFKKLTRCDGHTTRTIQPSGVSSTKKLPTASVTSHTTTISSRSVAKDVTTALPAKPLATTPSVVSGITTVTTSLFAEETYTSQCKYSAQTGSINGKHYKAAYEISGKTETEIVAGLPFHNRILTVTWFFEFDKSIDAKSFRVRQLGFDISAISGTVNLEQGAFVVSYEVKIPLITYLATAINYCLFEYVAFDFHKVDSAGNDFFYLLYTDNLGSALVDGLRETICDVFTETYCPLYQSQLAFDCDAFKRFDKCDAVTTITLGSPASSATSQIDQVTSSNTLAISSGSPVAHGDSTSEASSILVTSGSTTATIASTTPDVVSGITTVTTSVGISGTFTSECDFETETGSINGKKYKAAYAISGETTTSTVAGIHFHNRVLTVIWFFQFDKPLDANDFKVRQLGIDISSIDGEVNLEQGAFVVSYQVTLPFITYLTSALNYCLLEYVAFDFHKVDSSGNDFYYLLYTDNLGSALVDGLRETVCDLVTLTNCPLYQAQLAFDCDAFKDFQSCHGATTFPGLPTSSSSTVRITSSSSSTKSSSSFVASSSSAKTSVSISIHSSDFVRTNSLSSAASSSFVSSPASMSSGQSSSLGLSTGSTSIKASTLSSSSLSSTMPNSSSSLSSSSSPATSRLVSSSSSLTRSASAVSSMSSSTTFSSVSLISTSSRILSIGSLSSHLNHDSSTVSSSTYRESASQSSSSSLPSTSNSMVTSSCLVSFSRELASSSSSSSKLSVGLASDTSASTSSGSTSEGASTTSSAFSSNTDSYQYLTSSTSYVSYIASVSSSSTLSAPFPFTNSSSTFNTHVQGSSSATSISTTLSGDVHLSSAASLTSSTPGTSSTASSLTFGAHSSKNTNVISSSSTAVYESVSTNLPSSSSSSSNALETSALNSPGSTSTDILPSSSIPDEFPLTGTNAHGSIATSTDKSRDTADSTMKSSSGTNFAISSPLSASSGILSYITSTDSAGNIETGAVKDVTKTGSAGETYHASTTVFSSSKAYSTSTGSSGSDVSNSSNKDDGKANNGNSNSSSQDGISSPNSSSASGYHDHKSSSSGSNTNTAGGSIAGSQNDHHGVSNSGSGSSNIAHTLSSIPLSQVAVSFSSSGSESSNSNDKYGSSNASIDRETLTSTTVQVTKFQIASDTSPSKLQDSSTTPLVSEFEAKAVSNAGNIFLGLISFVLILFI
ncbi:hypothetical protein WICANDRAFT_84247 [Wickerhamomyces anomalus NRRL Y-366-8]|uniref:Flo11 domain-containing protein n=1 Tax=Wickerhamomyces anomalus (strain ATCC 58044 / CBS 1984 / NCYC 433 / NRRL Y-366-8) TaxID=683960 RepID=A0A1E3P4X4_WICAA|nr:uncharacterized protein WICANDRAFT_84247 [Wickerhamomyces anomalus NRRL Y-366-8]ODQ60368.1 hypothetical protein WICANDRAFT_84247 [Wickerhamomyces anomalus NRRL Y-366-8]